jgi:hypothetical protein
MPGLNEGYFLALPISGVAFTTTGTLAVALALGLTVTPALAMALTVAGVILATATANDARGDTLFQLFEFEIQMFHLIFPFSVSLMLLVVFAAHPRCKFRGKPCRKSVRTNLLTRFVSELAIDSELNISASLVTGRYARYCWLC